MHSKPLRSDREVSRVSLTVCSPNDAFSSVWFYILESITILLQYC
jgi:hypothetical protein